MELDDELKEWCKFIHDIWQVNILIDRVEFPGRRVYNIVCWRKLEYFAVRRIEASVFLSEAKFNDKEALMLAISERAEECQLSVYNYALTKAAEFPAIGGGQSGG